MLDELARTVEAARERFRVPGVSFGVLADGGTETAAFGVTSVEHPLDVTPDTLFQAGSITKTVTGSLALRLELDLDAPVRDRLPRLRLADESVAERVTLRHLLTHTGGWSGDYFDSGDWGDEALARMVDRLDTLPQLTPLGETFSYNNAGFYIAGRLLETVGDATYEELVRMHVLEPMGLDHSFFFPDEVMTHRFAVGHDVEGAVARPWPVGRPAHPAGGLVTTVGDLLRFARTHIEDESLRSMQEPQVRDRRRIRGGRAHVVSRHDRRQSNARPRRWNERPAVAALGRPRRPQGGRDPHQRRARQPRGP